MKHKWLWWRKADVETEWRQCREEGRDTVEPDTEFERILAEESDDDPAWQAAVSDLFHRTGELPVRPDFTYREPSDLESIRHERPGGPRAYGIRINDATARDRIHGAWLGRCAGCLLGKPIEGVRTPALNKLLAQHGLEMIPDYLWRLPGLTEASCASSGVPHLWRDARGVSAMPEDDDTNYTVSSLLLVQNKGIDFTPEDVADFWMSNLPVLHVCTAERVAYRNVINEIGPPQSATLCNPYREWIGAQIRADFFGYLALGRPEWAAEMAWRDASISHVKNGIYGAMWVAAMLASAAVETDVRRVVAVGLSEVPANTRFAEAIRDVLSWQAAGETYREVVARIHSRWDENRPHD